MADYNPYDQLPQVASFELTSEDVQTVRSSTSRS